MGLWGGGGGGGGGGKISIGTHTRSGSTMINTHWHAKINAQELFSFMMLPVGGTLIDLAVSMKARLDLYTNAHGTLIFGSYDECSPKNHERTHRAEMGYHWLRHETTDVTASPRGDHEKHALVSSRSLDEWTVVESHINGLYLTSWCRHHNAVRGSKSCIRRTQCHQDVLWRYGLSCTIPN